MNGFKITGRLIISSCLIHCKEYMKTLKESILQDADITLSVSDDDAKEVINGVIPTAKDFQYISMIWYGVNWECPLLMKKFAKDVEKVMQRHNDNYKAENVIGMNCMYRKALYRGHMIFGLYLYDKDGRRFNIRGIGGTTECIGARDAERLILKFIKLVCNDHSILDKMADKHNTAKGNWIEDTPYFKDFVKNL